MLSLARYCWPIKLEEMMKRDLLHLHLSYAISNLTITLTSFAYLSWSALSTESSFKSLPISISGTSEEISSSINALDINEPTETIESAAVPESSNIQPVKVAEAPKEASKVVPEGYKPPVIPTQKNSETYNGADRGIYCWSQNIMELGKKPSYLLVIKW